MAGMLTGSEIYKKVKSGEIEIDPFDKNRLNPNSYNLRLDSKLLVYKMDETNSFGEVEKYSGVICDDDDWTWEAPGQIGGICYLDLHAKDYTSNLYIPDGGIVLMPGILYLGSTMERTFTDKYVPMLNGRSSVGRKGLTIHVTAGFGDIGFNGKWTLEMTVIHPLKVYTGDEICQISFMDITGDNYYKYNGRYQNQNDVTASKFEEEKKGLFTDGTN